MLPFQNMSGDPEQEYFADGMVEDIITALSRFKSLFVIARNSSFTYKGKAVDIRQVGRELGVRYVLEGSVRKAGAASAHHRPADRGRDRGSSVGRPVRQRPRRRVRAAGSGDHGRRRGDRAVSEQAEIRRANRKPTENLQAYDWLLRALRRATTVYARRLRSMPWQMARRAIELDPRYAQAYGRLASWIISGRILGWMEDEAGEIGRRRALRASGGAVGAERSRSC